MHGAQTYEVGKAAGRRVTQSYARLRSSLSAFTLTGVMEKHDLQSLLQRAPILARREEMGRLGCRIGRRSNTTPSHCFISEAPASHTKPTVYQPVSWLLGERLAIPMSVGVSPGLLAPELLSCIPSGVRTKVMQIIIGSPS